MDAAGAMMIEVQAEAIDVGAVLCSVQHSGAGGIVLFVGMVRDSSLGRGVSKLEYEAYEGMARAEMRHIAEELVREHSGVRLSAVHRTGILEIGDIAIVCAASAAHRDQAFSACRAFIDRIKQSVPIWKREHGVGVTEWIGWNDETLSGAHEP